MNVCTQSTLHFRVRYDLCQSSVAHSRLRTTTHFIRAKRKPGHLPLVGTVSNDVHRRQQPFECFMFSPRISMGIWRLALGQDFSSPCFSAYLIASHSAGSCFYKRIRPLFVVLFRDRRDSRQSLGALLSRYRLYGVHFLYNLLLTGSGTWPSML